MDANIEKLIKMAAEGGSISDRQREIILRKAQEAGEDLDEVKLYIKMALNAEKQVLNPKTEEIKSNDAISNEQAIGKRSEKMTSHMPQDNQDYKPVSFPAPPVDDNSFLGKYSNMFGIKKGCLLWIIIGFGLLIISLLQNLIEKL